MRGTFEKTNQQELIFAILASPIFLRELHVAKKNLDNIFQDFQYFFFGKHKINIAEVEIYITIMYSSTKIKDKN